MKPLSGAAQDAFFRRLLAAHASLSALERERLVALLRREVAELRLAGSAVRRRQPAPADRGGEVEPPQGAFDPYAPNLIVVLRREGPAAALAALARIERADDLRRLARAQRLAIAAGLRAPGDLRTAILKAAARRIANRKAAAG
jgi:hypothetical protein